MQEQSHLFSPLYLRGQRLPNRIGVSPMCQYACKPDGLATPWHLVHLGARAAGGAGLIVAEATAVSAQARISDADLGLWSQAHAQALRPVTEFISGQGSVPGIQLAHAGRKGSTRAPWVSRRAIPPTEGGWEVQSPSALLFAQHSALPRAMDAKDIAQATIEFAEAAQLAHVAGFRYLELHFGHGYLAHQFLSPLTNQRHDEWGGSFENRTRFAHETAIAVRKAWPDNLPLAVRLSMTDWTEGGWTVEDAIELVAILGKVGVDLVICSSGAIIPGSQPPQGPAMQLPFARRVRKDTGVASGAVGQITEPIQAEEIVAGGGADLVFLARQMLRNPQWALHAAGTLGQPASWPLPYARAVVKRPS